jgi:hypothetical protein
MLLALVVGVLIGARACNTVEPPAEPQVETVVEERVVYECPPEVVEFDAGTVVEATAAKPDRPTAATENTTPLPDVPQPRNPAQRRRLLDWVGQQSRGLTDCAGGGSNTLRTTVTLQLDEDGSVSSVSIVNPSGEIDRPTESCLRQRMMKWTPPKGLVERSDRLIFGLVI